MTLKKLIHELSRQMLSQDADAPVVLIVEGAAYSLDQVWFEQHQFLSGAICLGDDPQ